MASTAFQHIVGLSEISDTFDLAFCDVWGVVHNGREAFADACDALSRYRSGGGGVVLVTNAPVPEKRVLAVMDRLGVPKNCYDRVATSGDATRRELIRHGGPVYAIGVPGDTSVYEGLDLEITEDISCAAVICCTSLRDYPDDEPERYRDEMKALAKTGLDMICANPDVQFRHGDRLIWSAGALAELFEQYGGTVLRSGKPDRPIYDLAREEAAAAGLSVSADRILAIGDGPDTDIRGAMNEGVRSLFIGDGIHGHTLQQIETFADDAADLLKHRGVEAEYVASALRW